MSKSIVWVALLLTSLLSAGPDRALAEGTPSVAVTGVPADQDTTISIRKGEKARALEPDYRVDSGSEEISGEPLSGQQESYESWKKACAEWKKDMREMNGKMLITLNCGTPHPTRDNTSRVTQTSMGTYKIKVRVRDAQAGE